MEKQQKIDFLLEKLEEDAPMTNLGKILKLAILGTIPSLGEDKLDELVTLLGGDINEDIQES